jgi:hypothetical protein
MKVSRPFGVSPCSKEKKTTSPIFLQAVITVPESMLATVMQA